MRILVIEDVKASLLVYSSCLRASGATVIAAESGYQALEAFERENPDLILLDVMLPDIDGFEVARRIRRMEKPGNWTPIIFVSAKTSDEYLEQGIAAGGDDYIYKPVSEVVLRAKVKAMQRIVQMRTSLVVLARKLDSANQELQRLSSSDGLTGLPNRRLFDETLEREWRRARREGAEITLMMCDVDHFKAYNDTYGHQAGDDCLKQVALTLRQALERGADLAARYGGEEFAIILPGTGLDGALIVAHKMLNGIRELRIPHTGSPFGQVTASIGIASMVPGEGPAEALIEAADQALYRAKREGRNRVCHPDSAAG
ncbi:MAG: diguanylate cyclase [Actinomycetota bacterium]